VQNANFKAQKTHHISYTLYRSTHYHKALAGCTVYIYFAGKNFYFCLSQPAPF